MNTVTLPYFLIKNLSFLLEIKKEMHQIFLLIKYRVEIGHAFANFASYRTLSEKQQFLCFSQVPTGSDCLHYRPIMLKCYICLIFSTDYISIISLKALGYISTKNHSSENPSFLLLKNLLHCASTAFVDKLNAPLLPLPKGLLPFGLKSPKILLR